MVQLQAALEPYKSRLLMQVHDELVLEVPVDEVDDVRSQIKPPWKQRSPQHPLGS
nr:hypothetical protein [Acaryochloris sp. CCMEE 5410]